MSVVDLVTGGAGFVGAAVVDALKRRGRAVRVLDLRAREPDSVAGSVTDRDAVARAIDGVDTVYHLAGIADLWRADPTAFELVNHEGTRIVLEAAEAAGATRFVFCSSATTLVARNAPIGASHADESLELSPGDLLGAYPASKRRAELAVIEAARRGVHAVIVNPTEPLGPGDRNLTPPTRMMLDFLNGATPAYVDCLLNFTPTADLAAGMIAAAERGRPGERYILAGEDVTLGKLLTMLTELTGRPTPKAKLPYWAALAVGAIETRLVAGVTGKPPKAPLTGVRLAGRQVSFSREKAERELGWRAGPLRPALQAMLDWAASEALLT